MRSDTRFDIKDINERLDIQIWQDLPQNARTYLITRSSLRSETNRNVLVFKLIKRKVIIVLKRCFETNGDPTVLDCAHIPAEEPLHILREEVEAADNALKTVKSARVDNILAELGKAGGNTMIDELTSVCIKILKTGESPPGWTWLSLSQRKGTCSFAKTTEPSALSAIQARSY